MATPDKKEGVVRVTHFDRAGKQFLINAHISAISALALNSDGSLLATASQKGQVIRIFLTENGQQIQELRRGTDNAVIIGINFDPVSKYIGCTSDKGTIHIFGVRSDVSLAAMTQKQMTSEGTTGGELKTIKEEESSKEAEPPKEITNTPKPIVTPLFEAEGLTENPKSMFAFMKILFPRYFDTEWSLAQFRIQDMHSLCTIRDKYVIAITKDGNYYMAEIDLKVGGECKMVQHRQLIKEEK